MAVTAAILLGLTLSSAHSILPDEPQNRAVPTDLTYDRFFGAPKEAPKPGWTGKLVLSATGAWGHNSNVVGATDGSTVQVGILGDAEATFRCVGHEWIGTLNLAERWSRTPQLERYIKAQDELRAQTTYLYHPERLPWLGPYAQASVRAQLLDGFEVSPEEVTVQRTRRDGDVVTKTIPAQTPITLTKGFEPVILRQGLGVFANPLGEDSLTIQTKAGAASQQILVRNGFAIRDNADTPVLEIAQLEDSTQVGAEADARLFGVISEAVFWELGGNLFYALYTEPPRGLAGDDLINVDLRAKLSVRLKPWLTFDYVVNAKRVPVILRKWQVHNGATLTVTLALL